LQQEVGTMRNGFLILAIALLAVPAFAGAPIPGIYFSNDMGGPMLTGRFSESWVGVGGHGQIGNTVHALSWDGALLGTQWKLQCPHITQGPVLVSDTRDGNGTGEVTYRTVYGGGFFWLSKAGPWGDNTVDYLGTLDSFIATATYQYVFGQLLGIRSNVTTIGHFDDFAQCFEYTINNAAFLGSTDMSPQPANYPDFLDACVSGFLTRGGWGSVTQISMRLFGCQISVEPATWTAAKSLYR
jgi:hypothetical protein